eukprot:2368736-Rhodomonas_salina.3
MFEHEVRVVTEIGKRRDREMFQSETQGGRAGEERKREREREKKRAYPPESMPLSLSSTIPPLRMEQIVTFPMRPWAFYHTQTAGSAASNASLANGSQNTSPARYGSSCVRNICRHLDPVSKSTLQAAPPLRRLLGCLPAQNLYDSISPPRIRLRRRSQMFFIEYGYPGTRRFRNATRVPRYRGTRVSLVLALHEPEAAAD